jgi:hypothetical protein
MVGPGCGAVSSTSRVSLLLFCGSPVDHNIRNSIYHLRTFMKLPDDVEALVESLVERSNVGLYTHLTVDRLFNGESSPISTIVAGLTKLCLCNEYVLEFKTFFSALLFFKRLSLSNSTSGLEPSLLGKKDTSNGSC